MSDLTASSSEESVDFLSRPLLVALSLDWEKAIYLLLIVAAALTRFWDLGGRVMSHDESLHTQFSYQFYNGDGYSHTPLMHGPLLFHVTAAFYWLFGASDYTARAPVAILGIVLVAMPYLFRAQLGRIGALFTSFLFLISPFITYYSRYIRHDIYIIVWALIVFAAIWFYLTSREQKYLWWFAAGTALMFSTKEVSFIYVAIFGSFLVLRLLVNIWVADWFGRALSRLTWPFLTILVGLLLVGGGLLAHRSISRAETATESGTVTEGFAVDPSQDATVGEEPQESSSGRLTRWLQVAGIGIASLGIFMAARQMRPHIDQYPEFDLIMLFSTLVLPTVSPLLVSVAGWNPRDYTLNLCVLEGQESMTSLGLLFARMGNSICRASFLSSGVVRSGSFLIAFLLVAIVVGLWWNRRRWLVAAVIFHSIFAVLYTSVFTNPSGWSSGMIGSLGYWLEQQEVERGNQPGIYYFFLVPFYEFLCVIFSLAAARYWLRKKKLNKITGYWLGLVFISLLVVSLTNWWFNQSALAVGGETSNSIGRIVGMLIFGAGILYWFLARNRQLRKEYELPNGLKALLDPGTLTGFVPSLIWWLLLTLVIYSYAGEKMPWLSTHFVIPMSLLCGWYFNQLLGSIDMRNLLTGHSARLFGLTIVLIVAVLLALAPLFLGNIQFGNQELKNLNYTGRFLGSLLLAAAVYYLWRRAREQVDGPLRPVSLVLAFFALLSLLTIRFTYMASFPNADYATEFMVYAHGAPATKNVVMEQVEELSMRLYGDKSIKVAFSQDTSWPFTWYLRDYPNRVFYGDNPSHSLTESPAIITGSLDWAKTEPYLANDYEQRTYTYLWWPMEEYRKLWNTEQKNISWNAIFGDPNSAERRGLGNPRVRQALWDIFFYRDYEKYGQVFGGTYTLGQWPLRHEMRLYIRKDVLADLWDYGIGAVSATSLVDPYAEGELHPQPILVLNESGIGGSDQGQLIAPRNVAVGADGRIYVADSGNHRIQVFGPDGQFLYGWGGFGAESGRFNEPWSILVDEQNVFVADTWNHRIQKFSLEGDLIGVYGRSGAPVDDPEGEGLGLFFGPRDMIDLGNGQLLITDTGNHRLQVMDKEGNFIRQAGAFGNLLGQLNEPVGLGVAADGTIFLTDTWNKRIQQFAPQLFAINEWDVDAWDGQSTNNKPYLAADSAGRLYVTDPEGYRVLIFSNLGDYLGRFGTFGTDLKSFGLPNGIAIDTADNVYIADAGNNRVLKYAPIYTRATGTEDDGLEEVTQPEAGEQNGESQDNEAPTEEVIDVITPDTGDESGSRPTATLGE